MMGFFVYMKYFVYICIKLKNLYYVRKNYTSFINIVIVWDVWL